VDNFDVYIGTSSQLTKVSTAQGRTYYETSAEELVSIFGSDPINQVIYWRVDVRKGEDVAEGDVWSFDPRPAKATNPRPADEATDESTNVKTLSWAAATGAGTYSISFTDTDDLAPIGLHQTGVWVNVPGLPLDHQKTYSWRVDGENDFGTTIGDVWTFTTPTLNPVFTSWENYPDKTLGPGELDGEGNPSVEGVDYYYTGDNCVASVRRMIAAAGDSIWYEE